MRNALLGALALGLAASPARAAESPTLFWVNQDKMRMANGGIDLPAPIRYSPLSGQIVRASWYGGGERLNRHTSTGEIFKPWLRTAAHRSLPFGTRLEVTDVATCRRTVVRVNDRGPAAWTGRALDLSRGAAADLGMIGAGEARVTIRIVN